MTRGQGHLSFVVDFGSRLNDELRILDGVHEGDNAGKLVLPSAVLFNSAVNADAFTADSFNATDVGDEKFRHPLRRLHFCFPQPGDGDAESISELLDARQTKVAYRTLQVSVAVQGFRENLNHLTLFQSGNGERATSLRGSNRLRAVCVGATQIKTLSSQQRGHEHG